MGYIRAVFTTELYRTKFYTRIWI